ncbi:MAG: DJ-1/PfpI family protein [Candidatus Dormibacteria bacterium]
MHERRRIGVLMFDDVEELDAVGPWEVLSFWSQFYPDDGYDIVTFSREGGQVRCAKGLRVVVDHSGATVPRLDVLVYPGGMGTLGHVADPERLGWVRDQAAAGTLMTSVCTGSLVFAAAGILRNRPATTHWFSLEDLGRLDPTIDVRRDQRFVDAGDVVTAAGVSAGLDMALHLVARLSSAERAAQVARGVEYAAWPPGG